MMLRFPSGLEAARGALAAAAFCVMLRAAPAAAQAQPTIEDPAANSQALLGKLETDGSEQFTDEVIRLLKGGRGRDELVKNLRRFGKKKPDLSGVVYDRNYNNLIRIILIYSKYDDNIPFLYYQFTYKMTKAGWVMTNFRFESETSRAFPEGYAAP